MKYDKFEAFMTQYLDDFLKERQGIPIRSAPDIYYGSPYCRDTFKSWIATDAMEHMYGRKGSSHETYESFKRWIESQDKQFFLGQYGNPLESWSDLGRQLSDLFMNNNEIYENYFSSESAKARAVQAQWDRRAVDKKAEMDQRLAEIQARADTEEQVRLQAWDDSISRKATVNPDGDRKIQREKEEQTSAKIWMLSAEGTRVVARDSEAVLYDIEESRTSVAPVAEEGDKTAHKLSNS